VVRLKEQKDAQLTRSGADLRQTVWVSLHEALFGFTRSIAHPRGTPVLFDRGATGLTSHDEGVLIKVAPLFPPADPPAPGRSSCAAHA